MRITNNRDWHTREVANIKVSMRPKPQTPYSVFRIETLIDTGMRTPSIILKNALPNELEIDLHKPCGKKATPSLPLKVGDMACVYTGRGFGVICDLADTLQVVTGRAKLAPITPDVMGAGDFVIFKHRGANYKMHFAGVIRAIPKY